MDKKVCKLMLNKRYGKEIDYNKITKLDVNSLYPALMMKSKIDSKVLLDKLGMHIAETRADSWPDNETPIRNYIAGIQYAMQVIREMEENK
jgi:hypothetical protein